MTPSETPVAPVTTRGRASNLTPWVVQALLAVTFAFVRISLVPGLLQEVADHLDRMGVGPGFRQLTAAL